MPTLNKPNNMRSTMLILPGVWTTITLLSLLSSSSALGSKRPFYVIGHMINNASLIEPFLDGGSNVLESDVHFRQDGSVHGLHHGFPCDFGRMCNHREDLGRYLGRIRELTDVDHGDDDLFNAKNRYHGQLVMLFFDLKLSTSGDKRRSGEDMLDYLLNHLWAGNEGREMKVLLYVETELDGDFIDAFAAGLKRRQLDHYLSNVVAFDCGAMEIDKVRQMFANLDFPANVWQGDGVTNFFRPFRTNERRLKQLLSLRDSPDGLSVDKVYDWTVDKKSLMRSSLRLGVDGMITNEPRLLRDVLDEPEFRKNFRLATLGDDPFARFVDESI